MMMAEYEGRRVQQKHHGSRILHIGNVVRASVHIPRGCLCSAKSCAGFAHELGEDLCGLRP